MKKLTSFECGSEELEKLLDTTFTWIAPLKFGEPLLPAIEHNARLVVIEDACPGVTGVPIAFLEGKWRVLTVEDDNYFLWNMFSEEDLKCLRNMEEQVGKWIKENE